MNNGFQVVLAFFVAGCCSLFALNTSFHEVVVTLYLNAHILIPVLCMVCVLAHKRLYRMIRNTNRYSWLIMGFYFSSTLLMEAHTIKHSLNFEGVFITLPPLLALVFWAQKSGEILRSNQEPYNIMDGYKTDLFLITSAFFAAGCLELILDINNSDLRGFWPFYLFFMMVFGFMFAFLFSAIGLVFYSKHKRYTLVFSAMIVFLLTPIVPLVQFSGNLSAWNYDSLNVRMILLMCIHLLLAFYSIIQRRNAS
ncbi:TPA: hypothetical protein KKX77_002644 [Legionella pneumophila]|nr:hypothetical protein [Legionella pneumophila]HCU5995173.1 hypothetical protein [Legionella pneumophila]